MQPVLRQMQQQLKLMQQQLKLPRQMQHNSRTTQFIPLVGKEETLGK